MSTTKVIPTAWFVAHARTFTDIPFSKEIFKELDDIRKAKNEPVPKELKQPKLAPQLEARYKLVNKLLLAQKPTQVIEVASGYSARGLDLTKDKSLKYVDFDFPEVIEEKQKIVRKISGENKLSGNWHFEAGSALEITDLEKACRHFDKNQPLAIVNEGLMRYLNFEQKVIFAKNVKSLLREFGGVWITSDISLRRILDNESKVLEDRRQTISRLTGMDINKNLFDSLEQAKVFFGDLGFNIESHSFLEMESELVSPKVLELSADQVKSLIGQAVVFVMKLKDGK